MTPSVSQSPDIRREQKHVLTPTPGCNGHGVLLLFASFRSWISPMEGKETSPLVRAFARARKDVVERMSGVDFAPMTPEEADARWQRAEQEVLLETNRAHDWRHRHSPWFRLYYHFF